MKIKSIEDNGGQLIADQYTNQSILTKLNKKIADIRNDNEHYLVVGIDSLVYQDIDRFNPTYYILLGDTTTGEEFEGTFETQDIFEGWINWTTIADLIDEVLLFEPVV